MTWTIKSLFIVCSLVNECNFCQASQHQFNTMLFNDYYHNMIMKLKYLEIFPEKCRGKFRKFSGINMKFSGQFFRLTTLPKHCRSCWIFRFRKLLRMTIRGLCLWRRHVRHPWVTPAAWWLLINCHFIFIIFLPSITRIPRN